MTDQTKRRLAVIAGSGLSGISGRFHCESIIPFERIKGVGPCTVEGHPGEVRFCVKGAVEIAVVAGRRHVYEGGETGMKSLIEWLAGQGYTDLIAVSAAGSLGTSLSQGDLVAVKDVIDFQFRDRLCRTSGRETACGDVDRARDCAVAGTERGANVSGLILSRTLTAALEKAAAHCGIRLARGTLACCAGPMYESRSDVRFLRAAGAELATMSSAPEALYAHRAGMDVAILAAITNPATGVGSQEPGHDRVVRVAGEMADDLAAILAQLIENM